MSESTKVREELKAARLAKVHAATPAEAKGTLIVWLNVINGEGSTDLKSLAVHYRDALNAAIIRGDEPAQESALASLDALAARYG